MARKPSFSVDTAVAAAIADPLLSLNEVARRHGVSRSALTRAMRRAAQPPRSHPAGDAHAAHRAVRETA